MNPVQYVNYQVFTEEKTVHMGQRDAKNIDKLIERTKRFLRDHYNDDFVKSFVDREAKDRIRYYISDYIMEQKDLSFQAELDRIITIVTKDIIDLGVLQSPLDDDEITSIEINSPTEVIIEKNGRRQRDSSVYFQNVDHIYRTIDKMLMPMGKTLTASEPVIDANYAGFRINVIMDTMRGGVSLQSPIISIRKFPPSVYTDEQCIAYGNISPEIAEFFKFIYPCGPNTLVCGSTNSGKTTQLVRIPLYLDPNELDRIITIEDTPEMNLKEKVQYRDYPNIAALITKDHEQKRRRYDIARLVKTSLRQNPNWIIIGEVRDELAAQQALVAINTGHICALTLHANSAREGAIRMVQLAGNNKTVASQVGSTIDLIIFQEDDRGKRVVKEICEVLGFEGAEEPILNTIFKYNYETQKHEFVNRVKGMREKVEKRRYDKQLVQRWCEL